MERETDDETGADGTTTSARQTTRQTTRRTARRPTKRPARMYKALGDGTDGETDEGDNQTGPGRDDKTDTVGDGTDGETEERRRRARKRDVTTWRRDVNDEANDDVTRRRDDVTT